MFFYDFHIYQSVGYRVVVKSSLAFKKQGKLGSNLFIQSLVLYYIFLAMQCQNNLISHKEECCTLYKGQSIPVHFKFIFSSDITKFKISGIIVNDLRTGIV